MSSPRVYVETTIPSFYFEERTDPDIVARRVWTRQWWEVADSRYELVTSVAVLDELAGGPPERSPAWLSLVATLPLVPVVPAVADIVAVYVARRVMPADPAGDALHVALGRADSSWVVLAG